MASSSLDSLLHRLRGASTGRTAVGLAYRHGGRPGTVATLKNSGTARSTLRELAPHLGAGALLGSVAGAGSSWLQGTPWEPGAAWGAGIGAGVSGASYGLSRIHPLLFVPPALAGAWAMYQLQKSRVPPPPPAPWTQDLQDPAFEAPPGP